MKDHEIMIKEIFSHQCVTKGWIKMFSQGEIKLQYICKKAVAQIVTSNITTQDSISLIRIIFSLPFCTQLPLNNLDEQVK